MRLLIASIHCCLDPSSGAAWCTRELLERSPDSPEVAVFLELVDQVFDRFRPDVLPTYGGHLASLELM